MMTEEGLTQLQELTHKLMAKASVFEARRQSALSRLRQFPLWKRVLFYEKFNKIRAIIKKREMARSYSVMMALGTTRKVKLIRRKIRLDKEAELRDNNTGETHE